MSSNRKVLNVRIDGFKPREQNTLKGFLAFTLVDFGLRINGAAVHEKEGKRWIGMPAREYATNEGRAWAPIIEFADKEGRYRLNDAVLAAFDEFTTKDQTHPLKAGGDEW